MEYKAGYILNYNKANACASVHVCMLHVWVYRRGRGGLACEHFPCILYFIYGFVRDIFVIYIYILDFGKLRQLAEYDVNW